MSARIVVKSQGGVPQLLIDGVAMRYGRLPGGLFFLHQYAYDPSNNLKSLAQKFLAYQRRIRATERAPRRGAEQEH